MHAEPWVSRSGCGRRWRERLGDDRAGLALAQRLGLPEIVGRLLARRGVGVEDAERFLSPTLRDSLPDPAHLKDMDAAGKLVARGVDRQAIDLIDTEARAEIERALKMAEAAPWPHASAAYEDVQTTGAGTWQ